MFQFVLQKVNSNKVECGICASCYIPLEKITILLTCFQVHFVKACSVVLMDRLSYSMYISGSAFGLLECAHDEYKRLNKETSMPHWRKQKDIHSVCCVV